jgi:lactoylglutathione lyase
MTIQFQAPTYVIVYVSNMQRSMAFYRDILGLTQKFTTPGWSEFATGTTTIALHTSMGQARQVATDENSGRTPAGSAQLGFVVEDIQATYETLRAQDVPFSLAPQKQSSGVTLAILQDPDGFGICLQQR